MDTMKIDKWQVGTLTTADEYDPLGDQEIDDIGLTTHDSNFIMKRYEAQKTDRTLGITKGHIYELEPNGWLSRLMSNGQTKFLTNGRTIIQSGKVKEI